VLALCALLPSAGSLMMAARPTTARNRHAPARMDGMLKIVHGVADTASVANFYTAGLGLSSETLDDGQVSVGGDGGVRLVLREATDGAYQPEGGYRGLSLRVPSVAAAFEAASACGGNVLSEPAIVVHGAGLIPEEPEDMDNEILEAVIADPAGYPILLHEAGDAQAASLSGVRCECHEWKTSQEWWEALGWKTVRWQSNVHREASLTVTLAPKAETTGPRGAADPVLQLTYQYGCNPITPQAAGGLEAFVLARADDSASELSDPDGYAVRFE